MAATSRGGVKISLEETTPDRVARAHSEPLSADRIAPGMFLVSNLKSDSEHVVDVRDGACDCADCRFRDIECKHVAFIREIARGELCSHCGYRFCRPSCPQK